jgi:hypothetical protein
MDLWFSDLTSEDTLSLADADSVGLLDLKSCRNLKRLFLGMKDTNAMFRGNPTTGLSEPIKHSIQLKALRELSLYDLVLDSSLYKSLTNIVEFRRLYSLTLKYSGPMEEFLASLVGGIGDHSLELRHLALLNTDQDIAPSLEMLFDRCANLKSLCLEWNNEDGSPVTILKSLDRIGDGLTMLSLHPYYSFDHNALGPEELEQICSKCPNLEQLGFALSDRKLSVEDIEHFCDTFVSPHWSK